MATGQDYHLQRLGEQAVAGIMDVEPQMGDIPPNWTVNFAVEDIDETVARARELGAQTLSETLDSPYGRIIQDPLGAVLAAIALEEPASPDHGTARPALHRAVRRTRLRP